MSKRVKWTGWTLAATLMAYAVYAVAAVPLIEPQHPAGPYAPWCLNDPPAKARVASSPPPGWVFFCVLQCFMNLRFQPSLLDPVPDSTSEPGVQPARPRRSR